MAISGKPIFHEQPSQSSGDSVEHSPETTNGINLVAFKAVFRHGKRNAKMSSDRQGLRAFNCL